MLSGVINSYFWLAPYSKPKVSCQTGCATDKERSFGEYLPLRDSFELLKAI
ncbi:hypothetical protein BSUW23_08960 [Bacillus spizizenii str. W23]|uniref:Uncharacterized protein n=1 Tax=Bacillus spizizenii (strain ATCC 23059 / NRRL B-14472 / W23) TaxID=655816 RepID=E0TVR2_BACSH|nr:hypothetical protein [Bacillus spizizenii]ADM37838.1 hypothetical protein BSUW23_08960 [Bacillus spizizenii str. W23]EFG92836.1 hypothetical protein BSU6633_07651 [Bacillus spizizenii ATCC 6633 = JCM 2499]MCY7960359.1 hypothetical protein [Bacillus spizizenii]MCY8062433.1 hypothetical protein [Bacillus spizizenii]MCY8334279.1 hypothetical protein [Bacillus spizizenii]